MYTLHRLITLLKQQGYRVTDVLAAEDGAQVLLAHKGYKAFARLQKLLQMQVTYKFKTYVEMQSAYVGVTAFTQYNRTCVSVYLLHSVHSAFPPAPQHPLP